MRIVYYKMVWYDRGRGASKLILTKVNNKYHTNCSICPIIISHNRFERVTFYFGWFSDVNWGSSTQAQTYKTALTTAQKLINVGEHVKNYKPQVLVLSGLPKHRPSLLDFANLITKNHSLLIVGDIIEVNSFLILSVNIFRSIILLVI